MQENTHADASIINNSATDSSCRKRKVLRFTQVKPAEDSENLEPLEKTQNVNICVC